jgi:8-oxo-dGTP pyrophosphatase MutT (NUDIX family)
MLAGVCGAPAVQAGAPDISNTGVPSDRMRPRHLEFQDGVDLQAPHAPAPHAPAIDEATPRRPVFARHAASLLVIREAASGTEVLMGMRGAGHRFMPNRLVFPGGAVDKADRTLPAAAEPGPALMAMLQRSARPPLARAIAMAAARELHEETGLSLGRLPRLDQLDYLCRAITPPNSPIRFNARFLIAPADAIEGDHADSHELQNVRFYKVDEVLREDLVIVTGQVLARLHAWLELPRDERAARTTLDVFRKRAWGTE